MQKCPLFKNRYFNLALLLILALFLSIISESYKLEGDSAEYINNYNIRAPLYPLIIDFFNFFSASNYLSLTFYFQLTIGFCLLTISLIHLIRTLRLPSVFYIILFFILFRPYYSNPFIGNLIYTEAITYPIFIFLCLRIIQFIFSPDYKSFLYLIILSCLLILTRKQFEYLFIVLPLLFFVFFYLNRETGIRIKNVISIFVAAILFTLLTDSGYHYLYNGHFGSEPGNGIWMVVPALYISNMEDTTVLKTQSEIDYFKSVYSKLDSNNMTLKKFIKENKPISVITAYSESWSKICWKYSLPLEQKYTNGIEKANSTYAYDKFLGGIAYKLIIKNSKNFFILISKNLIKTFDSNSHFILFMSMLLLIITQLFANLKNRLLLASLAILIMALCNNILIAIVLYPDERVLLYSDAIINMQLIIFSYYALKSFVSCREI